MAELILTKGLPHSGKTEWSRRWVDRDPANRIRLSRGDFRSMAMGLVAKRRRSAVEDAITAGLMATAREALSNGVSVVVDDVNLVDTHRRNWELLAEEIEGTELWVEDFFLATPLAEILDRRRRAGRNTRITEKKLRDMHEQYALKDEEDE